jgi:Glutaredoxin-like domain (DUF836)
VQPARLSLLGRHDCELCDELYGALMRDPRVLAGGLNVIDIESRPDLLGLHTYRVPVLFDGATEVYAGRLNEEALAEVLHTVFAMA